MRLPIYLDYSATTPVDPRVAEKMIPYLTEHFGNPASRSHAFGWTAEHAVEEARAHVAALINADPKEIVWTSGATEGNNLAIKGAANFYKTKGKHIITQRTEHKAVLDTVRELERQGFEATYLEVEPNGIVSVEKFKAAIRPDTILASIMMVNNEIGVIHPVWEIAEICRAKGIVFHCDAVQGAGRIEIDLAKLKADLLTITAHKIYGPKGIGALYIRRKPRVRIEAQIHGGGHERGFRSGTLATHQIVGFGEAARLAKQEMATESERVRALRDKLWNSIRDMEEVYVNGDLERRKIDCGNRAYAARQQRDRRKKSACIPQDQDQRQREDGQRNHQCQPRPGEGAAISPAADEHPGGKIDRAAGNGADR